MKAQRGKDFANLKIRIASNASVLPVELPARTPAEVKNEPMLFNCDMEHAYRIGGPITREFLANIPEEWKRVPLVIDTRVHMLMKGWFPCIPGWHHDDVPRTRFDGQPNYEPGQMRSTHIIGLINGDICPTELALGEAEFTVPGLCKTVYQEWHPEVNVLIEKGTLQSIKAPDRRLIHIDDRTWHQGTGAVGEGWRFFFRASRYYDADGKPIARGNPRTNELRRQVQVYLDDPFKGW